MTNKKDTSLIAPDENKINLIKYQELIDDSTEQNFIESFLAAFPAETRDSIELTMDQINELRTTAYDNFGIQNTLPLTCKADQCPFANTCKFLKFNIAPQGHPCPEEKSMIMRLIPKLIDDMEIDSDNYMQMTMLFEYIDLLMHEHRARKRVSLEGDVIINLEAIDSKTGELITNTKPHDALDIQAEAKKAKQKIRKELIATPEMRIKFDRIDRSTRASTEADIMERAMESQQDEIEEADVVDDPSAED